MIQLNTRNPIVLLNTDEREYLISEFIRTDRHYDLALMLSTLEGCMIDDMFIYGEFINLETYRKISQEVFNYFQILINKELYSEASKIIYKFRFNHYINSNEEQFNNKCHLISDYIQSELVDTMLKFLVELRLDYQLQVLLTDIYGNDNIPGDSIIENWVFRKVSEFDFRTLEYCITQGFISHEKLIDNFYTLLDKYDDDFLTELLFRIFDNQHEILGYSQLLFKKYSIEKKQDSYYLNQIYLYNTDQYRGFDFIRNIIRERLLVDMETDFYYNYLEKGRSIFIRETDKLRGGIYTKLNDWYLNILENDLIKSIFLKQDYVDKDSSFPLKDEDILILVSDVNTYGYLLELEEMDLYDMIIRLINISRFSFFKVRRKSGIENLLRKNVSDYNYLVINDFSRGDFLAFVLYL